MIREHTFILTENRPLSAAVRLLRFEGDTGEIRAPGQFVMISLPGKFLRRPFSVCDWDAGWFTVLVEKAGGGTELLHTLPVGSILPVLTGLGNGFLLQAEAEFPLLIGGGSGLSPLVGLARRLRASGRNPKVLLGFRNRDASFGADLFGTGDVLITEDVFPELKRIRYDSFYACGSEAMMLELCRRTEAEGQLAFDVRMGCGFGVCMGCSRKTRQGMKRVCADGPVFRKEDLVWED